MLLRSIQRVRQLFTQFMLLILYAVLSVIVTQDLMAEVYTWVDGRFYLEKSQELPLETSRGEKTELPSQNLLGDMVVNYYHDNLPYGSRIEILYGLGGTQTPQEGQPSPISWEKSGSVEAKAIGPYVWSAHIARSLTQFDGDRNYLKFEFCVRISLPNGAIYDPVHCEPERQYLEARIPWESVPQVDREHASWRRLPHAVAKHVE